MPYATNDMPSAESDAPSATSHPQSAIRHLPSAIPHTPAPWTIACDATLQAVVECAECPELFHDTLTRWLGWQTRNRTTVERVLNTPSLALQWFAGLLALGAAVTVEGQGQVPVEALLERRVKGRLVVLDVPVDGIRWGEAHVGRTPADEPIVSAVAAVRLELGIVRQARVALTGVWSRPVALAEAPARLAGAPLTIDGIRQVAAAIEAEVTPKGDFLGSAEFRRAMAGVMARRALEACLEGEAGHA
jgi:CO/xanthine dehydrogenase FAD-binding subunit